MGTKKWADINKLSKARETDHAEVRAELAANWAVQFCGAPNYPVGTRSRRGASAAVRGVRSGRGSLIPRRRTPRPAAYPLKTRTALYFGKAGIARSPSRNHS